MFGLFKKDESKLDDLIDTVLDEMATYGPDAPEYPALLDHLERLTKLKAGNSRGRVSPDQMALVAGNLLGILIIVAYEQKHVMTSTAKGFILKSK